MLRLYGLFSPSGRSPEFLLPVFIERLYANNFFIQKIASNGKIEEFIPFFDDGSLSEKIFIEETFSVGDMAIWAFDFDGGILFGIRPLVMNRLLEYLEKQFFNRHPFIGIDVAKFCYVEDNNHHLLELAYLNSSKTNLSSAVIWRDVSILLPLAREAIVEVLYNAKLKISSNYLSNVMVIGNEKFITVKIPSASNLSDSIFSLVSKNIIKKLSLAKIFGVKDIKVELHHEPRDKIENKKSDCCLIKGIGGLARQIFPFISDGIIAYPGKSITSSSVEMFQSFEESNVSMAFYVFPGRQKYISAAIYEGMNWKKRNIISVAVVTAPGRFTNGAALLSEVRPFAKLKQAFDYVVIVANHQIKTPYGMAPHLKTFRNGASFARSAIMIFMDMLNEMKPFSKEAFLKKYDSEDFCIVGKSSTLKNKGSNAAFLSSIETMLHEQLHFDKCSKIVVAQNEMIDLKDFQLKEQIKSIEQIDHHPSRPLNVTLAIGISPELDKRRGLFYMVYRLLKIYGWNKVEGDFRAGYITAVTNNNLFIFRPAEIDEIEKPFKEKFIENVEAEKRIYVVRKLNREVIDLQSQNPDLKVITYQDLDWWSSRIKASEPSPSGPWVS